MISEELRESYRLAAEACRYAAEQGWRPSEGQLVADHHSPTEWACCALGALAIKREVEDDDLDFAEALEFAADLPLSEVLGDTGGRSAALGVAYVFDQVVGVWDLCRFGLYDPSMARTSRQYGYVLRELQTSASEMAKLTPTEVWLLAAKRFEQLAN